MLPVPKYEIGCKVWWASTTSTKSTLPCPDCLGKREWEITAPSGDSYTIDCPRCAKSFGHYSNCLDVWSETPLVTELTIGSVRIDTNNTGDPVEYMCVETGVGSGRIYRESSLSGSLDTALAKAGGLAFDRQAAKNEREDYDVNKEFQDYTLTSVLVEEEKAKHRRCVERARELEDKVFALMPSDFDSATALYDKVCDIIEECAG